MSKHEQIRRAIRLMVADMIIDSTLQGKVKEVDKDKKTVTVTVDKDGLDYFNVRLMALAEGEAGKGLLIFPKVGSTVLIAMIEGIDTMYHVVGFSEIDSFQIEIEGMKFFIDKDAVKFNDGSLGGMVKIQELKMNLDILKNFITTMKSAIVTGLTAVGIGAAANGGTGATAFNTAMTGQTINFQDMEDTKVKH